MRHPCSIFAFKDFSLAVRAQATPAALFQPVWTVKDARKPYPFSILTDKQTSDKQTRRFA